MALTRRQPRPFEREVGYHDLLADLKKAGCPVCHGANRAAWRYLDGLLWESVNDPGVRAGLRAARGFCREHSLLMLTVAAKQGAGLGVAILYQDLLARVASALATEGGSARRRRRGGDDPLPRAARCRACESVEQRVHNSLRVLSLAEPGSDPYERIRRPNRGLCVPHLLVGLRGCAEDEPQRRRLIDAFLHGEAGLRRDLEEYMRKHDYRYHDEGLTPAEASAPLRAVHRMVGEAPPAREPER